MLDFKRVGLAMLGGDHDQALIKAALAGDCPRCLKGITPERAQGCVGGENYCAGTEKPSLAFQNSHVGMLPIGCIRSVSHG